MKLKINGTFISRIIFCISIIFFMIIQIFIYRLQEELKRNTEIGQEIFATNLQSQTNQIKETSNQPENIGEIWQLQIPNIELIANISEGTEQKILNEYIGHFKETPIYNGNIGLAAHNRGYDVNYFSRLKELREGDIIIYRYNEFERTYEVTKNKIIKDIDVDVLENTEENMLTLITCVENEPEYRRCVLAEEKDFTYNY